MIETRELRGKIMRAVKGADTQPELVVRRIAHRMGYRFRLRRKDLPGKPDIVFPGLHKVVFVHGCFRHGHDCARGARPPKANAEYWRAKIGRNSARDAANIEAIEERGWRVAVIWECELKDPSRIKKRLAKFLG
jgi:DNA mismatch endonuclease (patch repair protein)